LFLASRQEPWFFAFLVALFPVTFLLKGQLRMATRIKVFLFLGTLNAKGFIDWMNEVGRNF
jgi:hypothetical protein